MKAEDLRIKNLILVNGIVKPLTLTMMYEGGLDEYCEYIPLNKQWRLNLGFKNCVNSYYSYLELDENRYLVIGNSNTIYISESSNIDYYSMELLEANYVHQIQNLFFAIKGTELTYETES